VSGNSFGRSFVVSTFGESHGPALGCVVDGCPPGIPLTETDREPWLRDLARRMRAWEAEGGAVVACSALRRRHRELLAGAGPVRFVWLDADAATIRERIVTRRGHYMPPALLDSQLETLEPPEPDEAVRVEAVGTPAETARADRGYFPAGDG